jgi:hypothetical protein
VLRAQHGSARPQRATHLVRLIEHDPRQLPDLDRAERWVECLALDAVRLAFRDEHARTHHLRTLGRLRNDSHVEESLRGVVKVMCTGTARSNDIHNAE